MLGACCVLRSVQELTLLAAQRFSKEILLEREKWAGYIKARPRRRSAACLLRH